MAPCSRESSHAACYPAHDWVCRKNEFPDNPLTWQEWLENYGVPLWRNTMELVDSVVRQQ